MSWIAQRKNIAEQPRLMTLLGREFIRAAARTATPRLVTLEAEKSINKGVETYWNDEQVNRWVPMKERPIPFERMIYLGDGDTDIPSMKMVRHQGGHSIAVFDPKQWDSPDMMVQARFKEKAYNLIAEDRAHFVLPADYSEGSQLDVTVKGVLGRIANDFKGGAR